MKDAPSFTSVTTDSKSQFYLAKSVILYSSYYCSITLLQEPGDLLLIIMPFLIIEGISVPASICAFLFCTYSVISWLRLCFSASPRPYCSTNCSISMYPPPTRTTNLLFMILQYIFLEPRVQQPPPRRLAGGKCPPRFERAWANSQSTSSPARGLQRIISWRRQRFLLWKVSFARVKSCLACLLTRWICFRRVQMVFLIVGGSIAVLPKIFKPQEAGLIAWWIQSLLSRVPQNPMVTAILSFRSFPTVEIEGFCIWHQYLDNIQQVLQLIKHCAAAKSFCPKDVPIFLQQQTLLETLAYSLCSYPLHQAYYLVPSQFPLPFPPAIDSAQSLYQVLHNTSPTWGPHHTAPSLCLSSPQSPALCPSLSHPAILPIHPVPSSFSPFLAQYWCFPAFQGIS